VSHTLLWADLHTHQDVGYGRGSLERAIAIAQSHLDVWCATPQAAWPDLPDADSDIRERHLAGFEVTRVNWPRVKRLTAEADRPGEFVALLGYEWHSSRWGDWCLTYPTDEGDLVLPDTLEGLQEHARAAGALLIPHHVAYAAGRRGADFSMLAPDLTPVVEMYSEHGSSEHDRGPFAMHGHSMGGRSTANTLSALWAAGARVGVIAGTDDHLGCPGAYGEGLAGIWAAERTRAAVLEALHDRRTYAVTGDRVRLTFTVNGQPMGSEVGLTDRRRIEVGVDAPDELDRVEVLRDGRVIHRWFPDDAPPTAADLDAPVHCRIEFGWGPAGSVESTRVTEWLVTARIEGGQILDVLPCFQSGPFDEDRRNRVLERSDAHCRWESITSRRQAFRGIPTNAVILRIAGGVDTRLTLDLERPATDTVRASLGDLLVRNAVQFTGPFPSESLMAHRLVPQRMSRTAVAFDDDRPEPARYRVRVTESNGHMAWSSPIWVG